jgi:SAM-dependent methyltransferase
MNTMTQAPLLDRLGALADETRIRLLAQLERSELTVSELCTVLQLPQPTVSRHLKTLLSDGWVEARAEGRNRHYRIAAELDDPARSVWAIVHGELQAGETYAADEERANVVLSQRRLRSSAFFAQSAEAWDALRAELFGSATGLAPLLGLLDSGWDVGDLGVGTGALAARIAPFVERVIGVDRSSEMLEAAGARLEHLPNVELRRGELESLPLADESLDLAILALVLHHVVSPLQALREARRVLRPGGRLLLLDMRPHDRGREYADEMGHVWAGFAEERMAEWLEDANYRGHRIVPLPPDPEASGPLLFLATADR